MEPVLVGLLLIAGVWSVFLLPSLFGSRRDAPLNSTEEFDRWTHLMADVQKRPLSRSQVSQRELVRWRRRRTVAVLVGLAIAAAAIAWLQSSWAWLLVHLFFDSLLGLYATMLSQVKERRQWRLKVTHVAERPAEFEEPAIRIIAN
jgi:ferric-dicitrate binding protein FerR (iron transport regulator)